MAKVYILTEAELDKLIETTELVKLRYKDDNGTRILSIDDVYRSYNYHIVKWVQDVAGYKGG